jgi:hypothetical protein
MLIFPTDPRITRCALTAIVQVIVDKNILVVDTAKSAAQTSLIDLIAIRCALTAIVPGINRGVLAAHGNRLVVDTAKSAAHTSLIDLIAIRCALTAVISPNDL